MDEEDYGHGSIAVSLEDFEHHDRSPIFFNSPQASAFRSEGSDLDSDRSSAPWSPPAWRKESSGWLRSHRFPPPGTSTSHSASPLYESAAEGDDTLVPSNVPLPPSPPKETPMARSQSPEKNSRPEIFPPPFPGASVPPTPEDDKEGLVPHETGNYIRFAMKAEVQHRTDTYESVVQWARDIFQRAFSTWTSTAASIAIAFVAWSITRSLLAPPEPLPAPDILKATQIAKTFEPLIYYSESGSQHISDIQDTSVAVWDLGESVRSSNFTSATLIVEQLDNLSESFKDLAVILTNFFSNVEGDIDSILIVMEWSKRRLQTIDTTPSGSISSLLDNMHSGLSKIGLLETSAGPTALGQLIQLALGETRSQRNALTLRRTFHEFLNTLEESIANELQLSLKVFAEFTRIETQLVNIQRSVVRESTTQSREEEEILSSLWTRVLGHRASDLRKYERNRNLLSKVRETSTNNKAIIVNHTGKLQHLKSNLEYLRRRLVSPLVRMEDSGVGTLGEQIRGLEETWGYLKEIRERQRRKTLEELYAGVHASKRIGRDEGREIAG